MRVSVWQAFQGCIRTGTFVRIEDKGFAISALDFQWYDLVLEIAHGNGVQGARWLITPTDRILHG